MDIPVYLFTGFLGAGKTTFIQDILSSDDFNEGENTLLLLCEEGEEEYEPDKFQGFYFGRPCSAVNFRELHIRADAKKETYK